MDYKIDKTEEGYLLKELHLNPMGFQSIQNVNPYSSLEEIEEILKKTKIRNSGNNLICSKNIPYSEIIWLSKRLRISLNKVVVEGIEKKVL